MIYYTINTKFAAPQSFSFKSLGGFMSSTRVPNGSINNVFGSLSLDELKRNSFRIIGLIFKNEFNTPLKDIRIYFEKIKSAPYFKYKVGLSSVNINEKKEKSIELLSNKESLPYSVSNFYEPTLDDPLSLSQEIAKESYVGIWLKREFDKEIFDNYMSDEAIYDRFLAETKLFNEEVRFNIGFNESSIFDKPFDKPFE